MDDHTFNLLRSSVAAQARQLEAVLDKAAESQRGSTFITFVRRHLDAIVARISAIEASASTVPVDAKPVLGIALGRCRGLLTRLHAELVTYCPDVGRQDLPPGLLYLVDLLVDDLLKASADPIIHLDDRYMYSTQRVLAKWEPLSKALNVDWTEAAEPVIFNLPGLDPGNVFLAPVIAHEVGHSVIQRKDLVLELLGKLDGVAVRDLEAVFTTADSDADIKGAHAQFQDWAEELLCDALATQLTGPSFAFSIAVFFPASRAGSSGPRHPDPAQRFEQALAQLDTLGWNGILGSACPTTFSWLETLPSVAPAMPVSPREAFLRALVDLARPCIIEIAADYVTATLDAQEFEGSWEALRSLVAAEIPPAVLDSKPVPPWQIVLAAWLCALEVHGDTPEGLVEAVADRGLSRFTLKAVEMSRVVDLWGTYAP